MKEWLGILLMILFCVGIYFWKNSDEGMKRTKQMICLEKVKKEMLMMDVVEKTKAIRDCL